MRSITFPAMGFGAGIQMPKNIHLLPVLMSWPPTVDAEEYRFPVGSVSSLATWWTCFGCKTVLLHTSMRHPKSLPQCDLINY